MNYRHGYHAGNFADVVKHIALVAILQHLKKKDTAFAVIDSHAGRGRYDLSGSEAARTGEAETGIARLRSLSGDMPEPLREYLALANANPYPGSPLIAARLLRPQDRLTAVEKHPEEFAALKAALAPFPNALAENADGYARLLKLLPPPARRGVAVIDPPFELPGEFEALGRAVTAATRKFATGICLVWYPVKSQSAVDAFLGEVLAGGAAKALTIDTAIAAPQGKLDRAGLLVINPPFGFAGQMGEAASRIAGLMDADIRVEWRAGSE
ncbi:MAG TPA: 23S rRNA (adenine(2030)-N(6))-methyltransferase RlmJ [Rhizomicrobium sp.]|nr:23S rRNA (adenine(2030)-N(6))-methyltransferase RlmJ [Rhizomicrobium sp.]